MIRNMETEAAIQSTFMRHGRCSLVMHGSRPFLRGPDSIPLAKLQLAGNYHGVDFYVLRSYREPPDVV